ncbi:MAG: AAA family ATPase [Nitrososphaeraceae archaeon]
MVHIKKLEIYGFKSFGFKNTVINFDNGLIAVTGPNGSGKSNVLDAIMFSLGENSPKSLRVDRFQSLFHDSQNRSHRLVRVSITFENKDRRIPVNSDNVTLTREMDGTAGDSQYYLNGKKVTKSTITELLQIVIAIPNKLNIVQQGMITRISELNSEERRKVIEDIVGLSYFDEKKENALRQLDESDRRLDVALARMSEIRKRIDELESERNDQLRFEQIDNELKKYNAIKISSDIKNISNTLKEQYVILEGYTTNSFELTSKIKNVRIKLEDLDLKKSKFLREVNEINHEKAKISNDISELVYETEKSRASIKESEQRIKFIENRSKDISKIIIDTKTEIHRNETKIKELNKILSKSNDGIKNLKTELEKVDLQIKTFMEKQKILDIAKEKIENRYQKVLLLKNNIEVQLIQYSERLKNNNQKIMEIRNECSELNDSISKLTEEISNYRIDIRKNKQKYNDYDQLSRVITSKIDHLNKQLENSKPILKKSDNISIQYYEKNKVIMESMPEDFTISRIMQNKDKFKLLGIFQELIQWNKNYHRAVLAVAADWMKSIVVNSTKDMVKIAEFVKNEQLPRIKIISLDTIEDNIINKKIEKVNNANHNQIKYDNYNITIIGNLSDFIYSEFEKLPYFLFSDVIVTRTAMDAYKISQLGYTAVSINGELFESKSQSLTIDYNSKIFNFVENINLKQDIENLRTLIIELKTKLEDKNHALQELVNTNNEIISSKLEYDNKISNITTQISFSGQVLIKLENRLNEIQTSKIRLEEENLLLNKQNQKFNYKNELVMKLINKLQSKIQYITRKSSELKTSELNIKRTILLKQIEEDNQNIQTMTINVNSCNNNLYINKKRLNELDDEQTNLDDECKNIIILNQKNFKKIENLENKLVTLRNSEQEIIDRSGNSYSVLQTYEKEIKELLGQERHLSKENNSLEKKIVMLEKEISNLNDQSNKLNNDLTWLGYKTTLHESYDVSEIVTQLSDEQDRLRSKINLKANESYIQVINGYRGMSERKNDLESERNSIVQFIEEINKEKEGMFLDAYKKINVDINNTFSNIVGGTAGLEIENEQDIFSSGVRLVVQFPNKPKRESTALSGGEKTMAAIIFLLALQSIKPSPFYLMDEVDAHLDAQNTDRLSKILHDRSKKNQIIMVSLKDSTIAQVDQIYGVYPRNGVSQILKYKYQNKSNLNTIKVSGIS